MKGVLKSKLYRDTRSVPEAIRLIRFFVVQWQNRYAPVCSGCVIALVLLAASPTMAGDSVDHIRRLKEAGDILSLAQVLRRVEYRVKGTVLEAELENEHGRWVYEIVIRSGDGIVRELKVDAKNGRLLGISKGD